MKLLVRVRLTANMFGDHQVFVRLSDILPIGLPVALLALTGGALLSYRAMKPARATPIPAPESSLLCCRCLPPWPWSPQSATTTA